MFKGKMQKCKHTLYKVIFNMPENILAWHYKHVNFAFKSKEINETIMHITEICGIKLICFNLGMPC